MLVCSSNQLLLVIEAIMYLDRFLFASHTDYLRNIYNDKSCLTNVICVV